MMSPAALLSAESAKTSAFGAAIVRADIAYLYAVMFVASGAVFRFGEINTYLWYAIYLWTLARLCLDIPALMRATLANWPIFLWPALALASAFWSVAPEASVQGGMQLLMTTIIAAFIGGRFALRDILIALTFILFGAALVSLALFFVGSPGMFAESGGYEGVFAHKNTLGFRMNILIATALALLFGARRRLAPIFVLILFAASVLLILSKSATSQILALVTPAAMLALAAMKLDAMRAVLAAVASLAAAAACAVVLFSADSDPIAFILDSFGKDATLTGRTWLWERGIEEIAKHPMIGGGYQAFWVNDHSSEVLRIRHVTLESVKGFHNVGIEVWNDLGVPGFASLIGVLLTYARRAFRYCGAEMSSASLFPPFFLLIIAVSGSVNNSFFRQHELAHVLICAFFVATALPCFARTPQSTKSAPAYGCVPA